MVAVLPPHVQCPPRDTQIIADLHDNGWVPAPNLTSLSELSETDLGRRHARHRQFPLSLLWKRFSFVVPVITILKKITEIKIQREFISATYTTLWVRCYCERRLLEHLLAVLQASVLNSHAHSQHTYYRHITAINSLISEVLPNKLLRL